MKKGISIFIFLLLFNILFINIYADPLTIKYEIININDIKINYDDSLNEEDIFNYCVETDYVINNYEVESDYFLMTNVIGKYRFKITLDVKNYGLVTKYGFIEVCDYKNPIINNINDIYLDEYVNIDELFNNITAYDEIDGDLSDKIIIDDINSYKNSEYSSGVYCFNIEVSDNSYNKTIKNILVYLSGNDEEDEEIEIIYNGIINIDDNDNYNRDDFKKYLIKNGYYNEEDELYMSSSYFLNKDIIGEYDLYIKNEDDNKIFKIIVEKNIEHNKNNNHNIIIIITIIIILILGISGVILFILIKKRMHLLK